MQLISLFSLAIAFAAFLFQWWYFYVSWHGQNPLSQADFDFMAPMRKKYIPITYYTPGHLQQELPKWYADSGSHIHLYRVKEGENFTFNLTQVENKYVDAEVHRPCHRLESTLCPSFCEGRYPHPLTIGSILNRTHSADVFSTFYTFRERDISSGDDGGRSYASKVKDPSGHLKKDGGDSEVTTASTTHANAYEQSFPFFGGGQVEIFNAFISNFEHPRVSTCIHSNAVTKSAAIQIVGSKTWIFYPPEAYLGTNYFHSKPAKYSYHPTRSPSQPYDYYMYTSLPGDILFFSENWGHSVYSHAGPNYLLTIRKRPELFTLIFNDYFFFRHLFNFHFRKEQIRVSMDVTFKAKLLTSPACEGRLSYWDKQQLGLLKAEYQEFISKTREKIN